MESQGTQPVEVRHVRPKYSGHYTDEAKQAVYATVELRVTIHGTAPTVDEDGTPEDNKHPHNYAKELVARHYVVVEYGELFDMLRDPAKGLQLCTAYKPPTPEVTSTDTERTEASPEPEATP